MMIVVDWMVITEEEEGKSILIWMEAIVRIIRAVLNKHTSIQIRQMHQQRHRLPSSKTKKEEEEEETSSSSVVQKY